MTIRTLAACLVLVSFTTVTVLAVDGRKAQYVGGTISAIPEKAEGPLDTRHETTLTFAPDKKGVDALSIPYAAITSIEYGQKAGRRVGVAILVSPLALFSKKRKHFMTELHRHGRQGTGGGPRTRQGHHPHNAHDCRNALRDNYRVSGRRSAQGGPRR